MVTAPLRHAPKIAFALAFAAVLAISIVVRLLSAGVEPGPGPGVDQQTRIQWEDDRHGQVGDVVAGLLVQPDPSAAVAVRPTPDPDRVWVCVQPRSGLRVSADGGWKQVVGGVWSTRPEPAAPYWCSRAPAHSTVGFELEKAGGR